MSESNIEKETAAVEGIVNEIAPIAEALVPGGAVIAPALASAESVAGAVESALPHNTAVAVIGAGVAALAATPIVQANPQAAALAGVASSFMAWLHMEFAKL